ncbi:hypothetical protein Tco_0614021 [Tanacetum coccineum]
MPRQRRPNNSVTMTYEESRAKLKQQIVDTETSSFTSCEETWSSRYDVRETVGAGLRRARKFSPKSTATTCEGTVGHVYVRAEETWSSRLRRSRNPSRYDVRGTVGAGLRRARKLGQVATTCEKPSGQVYVVRENLVKSLRRARNCRGRFTSCEESWSSRYDVRGTVGAGLRRARKVSQVSTMCEEPSGQVYDVRVTLVKSLRRARNRQGRFMSCEETWSSRYVVRETIGGRFTSCEETWSSSYDVRGTVGVGLRRAMNLDRFRSRFLGSLVGLRRA